MVALLVAICGKLMANFAPAHSKLSCRSSVLAPQNPFIAVEEWLGLNRTRMMKLLK
jgi:hypothetical protein